MFFEAKVRLEHRDFQIRIHETHKIVKKNIECN